MLLMGMVQVRVGWSTGRDDLVLGPKAVLHMAVNHSMLSPRHAVPDPPQLIMRPTPESEGPDKASH
jgi:hypothetical protein